MKMTLIVAVGVPFLMKTKNLKKKRSQLFPPESLLQLQIQITPKKKSNLAKCWQRDERTPMRHKTSTTMTFRSREVEIDDEK